MVFKIPKREELLEFIESITNEKYRVIIQTGFMAGLRVREVVHLKVEHLDFQGNSIIVSEEGAKYHRARRVPMCSQLKETLFLWVERNKDKFREGYIFYPSHGNQYAKGKHLATITVMARFGEYYKRSKFYSCNKVMKDGKKMGNWSMHKLRHFFASYLNEKDVNIALISKALGHKDPSVTYKVYTHVFDQKKIYEATENAFKDFYKEEPNKSPLEIHEEKLKLEPLSAIKQKELELASNKESEIEKFHMGLV